MVNYRRIRLPGTVYFFTVTLADRSSRLLTEHVDDLRQAIRSVQRERPFSIEAAVILPDHLHCVWKLPPGDFDYSMRWREIKARFSRTIPRGERLSPGRRNKRERGIWQRRFWEHVLRGESDIERHVDYIHFNPVKHGYVSRSSDWPYSSFHRFVEAGIYPPDWGGGEGWDMDGFGE